MEIRGLSSFRAKKLLEKHGKNELRELNRRGPLKIFIDQIKGNFIIYLLTFTIILSFLIKENLTAYTILAVVIVVVFIGYLQEYKAEKIILSLRSMIVPTTIVIRDGLEKEIPTSEIVRGDIVVLKTGEKIPADCLILEQKELSVNEAILTGESREIHKKSYSGKGNPKEENLIYMGTFVDKGKCIAKVLDTGMRTKFGKIAGMITTIEKDLPLQDKTNKISKYMVIIGIVVSILVGLSMFLGNQYSKELLFDSILLVVAISVSVFPEGLPVVITLALSQGAYKMGKKNALVNRMSTLETLGGTTVICSDKTGTITKGEMTVKKIFANKRIYDLDGIGYSLKGDIYLDNEKVNIEKEPTLKKLLLAGVICNDSLVEELEGSEDYNTIGNSTEIALAIAAERANLHKRNILEKRIHEIPFSSERKIMSVLVRNSNKEKIIYSKGAPEYIINHCSHILRDNGIFRLTTREKERLIKQNSSFALDSLRTIGLSFKISTNGKLDPNDSVFLGIAAMEDSPREEIKDAVEMCLRAGIEVKIVTGDSKDTAISIANQIGINGKAILGEELEGMSEEELSKIVTEIKVFARVKPEHKLKIVRALKLNGEIVTMTGDGVNDAPALKEAHVGVAMGITGTDVSREVADLVLKDDNFATIVHAIEEGRTILKNVRESISYQLSTNYAELAVLFIASLLSPLLGWQIPFLLALQVLFINLATDTLPAMSFAFTPSSEEIMLEKPLKDQDLMTKHHWAFTSIAGIVMTIMTLGVYFISLNVLGQSYLEARTTALATLLFLEVIGAYNFLSFENGVSFKTLISNKYLIGGIIVALISIFTIIYTPLSNIFNIYPLPIINWTIIILLNLLFIISFNIFKKINNRKQFLKFS